MANIEIRCCGGQKDQRDQCLRDKCILYNQAVDAVDADRGFGPSDVYDLTPKQRQEKIETNVRKIIETYGKRED